MVLVAIGVGVFLATRGSDGEGDEAGATGSEDASTTAGAEEPGTTGGADATTTTEVEGDDLPEFPPDETNLTHGGQTWALYLAVARDFNIQAPEIQQAEQDAVDFGYDVVGAGELGCDVGAVEALGLDPAGNWVGVAIYFPDESSAEDARAAFEARDVPVAGIASVTTMCLD
jgi:hypothetical protein